MAVSAVFAYTDFFYSTSVDPDYVNLISSIKNGLDKNVIVANYDNYITGDKTDVEKARIEYHMARYYKDQKDKTLASDHIQIMRDKIDLIDKSQITDFESKVLEMEYLSGKYYVHKKLSDGMENSSLTKELAELYPDDVFSILNNCWRLIYAPGIAGGSPKKALAALDQLESDYCDNLSVLDLYSLYCAKAVALHKVGKYQLSDLYFKSAFEYYTKEGDIVEHYQDNLKKLK